MQILHASDRGSLIYNAFRLAEANQLSYDVALLMIDYLNRETHYFPWSVAAKDLSNFDKKLYGSNAHASFKVSGNLHNFAVFSTVLCDVKFDFAEICSLSDQRLSSYDVECRRSG